MVKALSNHLCCSVAYAFMLFSFWAPIVLPLSPKSMSSQAFLNSPIEVDYIEIIQDPQLQGHYLDDQLT